MRGQQTGFTLLGALFILIILSLLGAALMDQLRWRQERMNYNLLMAKAQLAAKTGVTLALKQANDPKAKCSKQAFILDGQFQSLSGFKVEVECIRQADNTLIQSRAVRGQFGQRDYVVYTFKKNIKSRNYNE